jgi:hypothetical protein
MDECLLMLTETHVFHVYFPGERYCQQIHRDAQDVHRHLKCEKIRKLLLCHVGHHSIINFLRKQPYKETFVDRQIDIILLRPTTTWVIREMFERC